MIQYLDIADARVYVTTFHKYNNGLLSGGWLDLLDYIDTDEFYEACAELHEDEEEPEFMFQNHENVPEGLIDADWICKNLFDVLHALEDLDSDHLEQFFIWCKGVNHDLSKDDIDDLISSFRVDYIGEYGSEEDFARQLLLRKEAT